MKIIDIDTLIARCGTFTLTADSRSVVKPATTIFAALRTRVNDGHRYIPALIEAGVKTFIVDHVPEGCQDADVDFLLSDDVADTLRTLARKQAAKLHGGIVVTGSYGKTTIKERLFGLLTIYGTTRRSPRSWNSGLGIAMTLWETGAANPAPQFFITEAGIDGPGQGSLVAEMIAGSHDVGVITPITTEHDGAFASHADKVAEKVAIVRGCDTIIYVDSDPDLRRSLEALRDERPSLRLIPVNGNSKDEIYSALIENTLRVKGMPTIVDDGVRIDSRIEIDKSIDGNTVFRDNFTPDIRTLEGTLDTIRRRCDNSRPKVLILGNLYHGILSESQLKELYAEALDLAHSYGFDRVMSVGSESTSYLPEHADKPMPANSQILIFGLKDKGLNLAAEALDVATHDTTLSVDLDALVHNYNTLRHLLPAGTGMICMVKADAYGAGAVEVGRTLQDAGAAYLAVAVIEEALDLRRAGITIPVMVMNPVTNRHEALVAAGIEPAIFTVAELEALATAVEAAGLTDYPIHIKLDTGMHRVGFTDEQLPDLIAALAEHPSLRVSSVFTHLATADCPDMNHYTQHQIATFGRMADRLGAEAGIAPRRHFLNTAGIMRLANLAPYDMVRPGIGLYGHAPYADAELDLRPVSALHTHIISLKEWPAGTPIGYGCKGRTARSSLVATIPLGYADGINRHLGRGHASFVVNGTMCPTIGNICMDQCMIDVTDAPDVAVGDSVEIFGPSAPVERLADTLGTISYEVLTGVSPRVRRRYFRR